MIYHAFDPVKGFNFIISLVYGIRANCDKLGSFQIKNSRPGLAVWSVERCPKGFLPESGVAGMGICVIMQTVPNKVKNRELNLVYYFELRKYRSAVTHA